MKAKIFYVAMALVLVLSFSLVTAVPAVADGGAREPPMIDGTISLGEWTGFEWFTDNTAVYPEDGEERPAEVKGYVTCDSENLYMAFDAVDDMDDYDGDALSVSLNVGDLDLIDYANLFIEGIDGDVNEDHRLETDRIGSPGCSPMWDGVHELPPGVEIAWGFTDHRMYELKVPLELLGVEPGDTIGIGARVMNDWEGVPGKWVNYFPDGLGFFDPATFADVTLSVENEDTGMFYQTIQAAIDAADTGDTINVAAGEYDGFDVNKTDITVVGIPGSTVISGAPIAVDNRWAPYTADAGVLVSANDVTIEGLKIHGPYGVGIIILNSAAHPTGVTIRNNSVDMTDYDPGLYQSGPGVPSAIRAYPGNGTATITGNTVEYGFSGSTKLDAGIQLFGHMNPNYIISGNNVTITHRSSYFQQGIGLRTGAGSATVTGNTIEGVGTLSSSGGIVLAGDSNPGSGANNIDLHGNTVTNISGGIVIWGPNTSNISITESDLTNNDAGVLVEGDASGISLHFNNIYGNASAGVSNTTTYPIDATNNWWGEMSGPTQATTNPDGLGNAVSENVDYMPWLTRDFQTVLAEGIGYYGFAMVYLDTGWNILSTPFALDDACDTWGDFVTFNDLPLAPAPAVNAYYFDGSAQAWGEVTDAYVLMPCDAIYVRMASPDIAALLANPVQGVVGSVPTKTLYKGWNLVGLSWLPTEWEYAFRADYALSSVAEVGSLTGYTQVVSPWMNQRGWTFVPGMTPVDWEDPENTPPPAGYMEFGKGYWVFMENGPDDLAGSWFTPMGLP